MLRPRPMCVSDVACAFALATTFSVPRVVHAEQARAAIDESAPGVEHEPVEQLDRDKREADEAGGVDLGVLGGVGFPRPLAIEAVVRPSRSVLLGAEYGFLPETTVSSVDARMWSVAADARYFPFKGAFFVGLRAGYQQVTVESTLSASNVGSYTEAVEMGTWFVNPRVGFLWVWKPFALGIDAGVQVPLTSTVSRSSLLSVAAPELDARITSATDVLGRTVLPTIDLLRVGVLF